MSHFGDVQSFCIAPGNVPDIVTENVTCSAVLEMRNNAQNG